MFLDFCVHTQLNMGVIYHFEEDAVLLALTHVYIAGAKCGGIRQNNVINILKSSPAKF